MCHCCTLMHCMLCSSPLAKKPLSHPSMLLPPSENILSVGRWCWNGISGMQATMGKGRQDPSMRVFSRQGWWRSRPCTHAPRNASSRGWSNQHAWYHGSRPTDAWHAFRRSRMDVPPSTTPAVLRANLHGYFDPLFPREGIGPAARACYSTATLEAPPKHSLNSRASLQGVRARQTELSRSNS